MHMTNKKMERGAGGSAPLGPEGILAAKQEWLIPCIYHFYKEPPQIVAAEGTWMFDHLGRRYLDCYSGVTVMSAGHANHEIIEAAFEQARTLQHTTSIYLTEPMVRLAEALAGVAPGRLRRSFFCTSGSEANEGAMLLASLYTGRSEFIALDHGLHGRTKLTMNATGLPMWRTDPDPLPTIHFVPSPYCARCPWEKTWPGCGLACAEAVERKIEEVGAERLAGIILEPIAGNGGVLVPPADYLTRLRQICDRHKILLILDEIQTGFGRTGAWFASEHSGVEPDIMTVAKALGNGFPISAFITRDEIAAVYTRPGASTFGGNPMCCAAALATIAFHKKHDLAGRARELGAWLGERLGGLRERPGVLDVRGRGLMWVIELAGADGAPDAARCDALLERAKDEGYLLGKTGPGRNVLTLLPPLVIERDDLEAMATMLDRLLC